MRRIFRFNYFKILFIVILIILSMFVFSIYLQLFLHLDWSNLFLLLTSDEVLFSIRFSLGTSISALLLSVAFGIPSAYILARYTFPGSKLIASLFYLPIFIPPLISGLALLLLFSTGGGQWLAEKGWEFIFSYRGVIIAQFVVAAPYAVRSFQTAFESVDYAYEEAAETFGDSPAKVFFKVTLPLSASGLVAGSLLAWARALGEFGATIMLAGVTRMKTETLPTSVYLNMSLGDLDSAIAVAIIMLLMAMILIVCLHCTILKKKAPNFVNNS